jgi:Tfp pilus assembly protein PilF
MEPPTPATVRGNFADAKFTKDGVTTTFSRRGDRFFVRTDGPDGSLHEYPVKYTFGWDPLQQYLLELPGGRLQALDIAWDARPAAAGGQRWFSLHPGEKIDHRDVLHWTGPALNWNHMCAECHSTNLVKGYDAKSDTFATTWSDVDVACEACHGPGSEHLRWAEARKAGRDSSAANDGLVFQLRDTSGGVFALAPGQSIAHRTAPPSSDAQLETCGRCHARRAQLWAEYRHGEPLAQTHRVSLLDADLYQPDGQIQDEVYEYGSFLQSRMHAAGVVCSDCHDPHSLKLRAEGNALCTRCHLATTYDVKSHHFHAPGSEAARCVSCHMPERVYMQIHRRRDHSIRVPRPDLSETIGTTNACNACHAKERPRWASAALDRWYGAGRPRPAHFAEALAAGRRNAIGAPDKLARTARDGGVPAIARATAIDLLAGHPGPLTTAAVREALLDRDPLVRRAAARASGAIDPEERAAIAGALLRDPVRTVRLEVLEQLLDVPPSTLSTQQRADLARVVEESRAVQAWSADRADANVNRGTLEARLGNDAAARAAFERAIRIQPSYVPSYADLAELDRRAGSDEKAEATLRSGLTATHGDASLHHALGLVLVRRGRKAEALDELAAAAAGDPEETRYAYVYAVGLHDAGQPERARQVLEDAQRRRPGNTDVLNALVQFALASGDRDAALRWARVLLDVTGDAQVRSMVENLQRDATSGG